MRITLTGRLYGLVPWENLLYHLPNPATDNDGLGNIWEHVNPPKNGGDPTVVQGWRLSVVHGVRWVIPRDAEMTDVDAEQSATTKSYTLVRVGRTAVHLHGVEIKHGVVHGDVHVCARVIWPEGADRRTDGTVAWRNYILFLDIYPTSSRKIEHKLDIFQEGAERSSLIMLGKERIANGKRGIVWATRSANWESAHDEKPSVGSDQLIVFIKTT